MLCVSGGRVGSDVGTACDGTIGGVSAARGVGAGVDGRWADGLGEAPGAQAAASPAARSAAAIARFIAMIVAMSG